MGSPSAAALYSAGRQCSRAATMSFVDPGSASLTHSGVPLGADRNCTFAPNDRCLPEVPRIHLLALAVHVGAGDVVRFDERSVQDHVVDALGLALVQDLVQIRGLVREDVNSLVEIAVAGGLGDPGGAGRAVHAAALVEPAQHHDRLAKRPQRTRALRCPQGPAVRGEQLRDELHDVTWDVEHGNIGGQRKASGSCGRSCGENRPTRGFTCVCGRGPCSTMVGNIPFQAVSPSFAKILSLRKSHVRHEALSDISEWRWKQLRRFLVVARRRS